MAAAPCVDLEKAYKHNLLVNELHNEIGEEKTKEIRQLLRSVLKKNLDAADMRTMLNDLTDTGMIKVGEYSYLTRLLTDIGLERLVDTVKTSEKEIQCLMDDNMVAEDENTVQQDAQENGERSKRKRTDTLDTSSERCAELQLKLELHKIERDKLATEFVLQIGQRALTDEVLQNPQKRKSIYKELIQFKAEFVGPIRTGSILLTVRFYSLEDLTYFWSKYKDGTVTAALSGILLSDKILEISREHHVEFYITCDISEDAYIEARRKLSSEDEVPDTVDAMARVSISDDTQEQEAMQEGSLHEQVVSEAKKGEKESSFSEETETRTLGSSEHMQERSSRFQSSNRRPRRSVETTENMEKCFAELLSQEKGFNLEQVFEVMIRAFALEIHPEMIDMPSCLQSKVLGSFVDGTEIPYLLHRDMDIMLVLSPPFFPQVTSRRETETTTETALVVENRGCHPGYVKLKIQGQHWLFEVPDILERDPGGIYLSNKCVQHYVQNKNSSSSIVKNMLEILGVHIHLYAPAATYEMLSSHDDLIMTGDFIASFPWNGFPRVAGEWLTRSRSGSWPNMEQIRVVTELGCHLVPVANPGDRECRTEWRISFALAERHLALSFNQVQRHVYRSIKLIHKHRLGETCILSSYHLKTTLFWLCERIPQDRWTNKEMGQRFCDFYDLLFDFLHKKCIPNYFIPDNNMIDHLGEKVVSDIVNSLHTFLENPKAILTDIASKDDIPLNLINQAFSNRFLQDILRPNLQEMVYSSDVLDSVKGEAVGAVDALSKNDSGKPLRKEQEDLDSNMGAVRRAVDASLKDDLDNPLRLETEEEKRQAKLVKDRMGLLWLPNLAAGVGIFEDFGGFSMDASTFDDEVSNESCFAKVPWNKEFLVKIISWLKAIGFKQRPADEHADDQETGSRKLSHPTHDQNYDQHYAESESFDSFDEDRMTQSGNKKNRFLALVELFVDMIERCDLELDQTLAEPRLLWHLTHDENDDQHCAESESFDSLD